MHMTTLHKTAYNRAKTCARAAGVGLPERVSASREAVARGRARAGAFAPVGGALASFIGETLAKAAPGKSRAILVRAATPVPTAIGTCLSFLTKTA